MLKGKLTFKCAIMSMCSMIIMLIVLVQGKKSGTNSVRPELFCLGAFKND